MYTANVGTNVYAVKIEDFHQGDEEQANLLVELTILQSFPHDRLVKFIIAGCQKIHESPVEYKIMIVMELCKNGALREVLKRKISWPLKVRLALDISQGIAFLHDNGIIHRDIKTTNVLVDDQWRAKLCDFSFAIHNDSKSKRHYTYGTEEFMSPEIAFALDFDLSTDIFSFGILLCEIMTDIEPSIRKPQESFALNEEDIRSRVLPDCPEAFEALALQCCESDPSKRPSVATCVEELETILAELGGVKSYDLPNDNNIVLRPEVIKSTNSPEREGRVQSTRNITIGNNKEATSTVNNNHHLKELQDEIDALKHEGKKMSKELHSLSVVSANRDMLFSKLLSKIKGSEVVSKIDRDELNKIGTDMIMSKLESNLHSMETELNNIQTYSSNIDKREILGRLNSLEESINDMKTKLNLTTQSEKRIPVVPIKPIEIKESDEEVEDFIIDLVDFPTTVKKDNGNNDSKNEIIAPTNTNVQDDVVLNDILLDDDDDDNISVSKEEFPKVVNNDKKPTADLDKALGSFLSIIGKCSENNNRTRELMSNLDRIADAKLSYNTPNKLKVMAANAAVNNTTPKPSTMKDFTWRDIETPSVNSYRIESSLIQDTISKRLKSVSPSHHFQGKFSPRISTTSSIGKNSIGSVLRSADTDMEKKVAVSKFFEPPRSVLKTTTATRIDTMSSLDYSFKEKSDYNRRLVPSSTKSNPTLERFSPEKSNAMKYQELLEQKYT